MRSGGAVGHWGREHDWFYSLAAGCFLKAFAVGEFLSFASPKERNQRKGDPGSLESPL
jgi:hypothetical protein